MAKARRGRSQGDVNKSQAIRDQLQNNPNVSPKDIAAALQAQGIDVSPQLVSNVKTALGKKGGPGRSAGRPANKRKKTGRRAGRLGVDSISVQDLMEAKRVVEQVGSLAAVRKALDALESLRV